MRLLLVCRWPSSCRVLTWPLLCVLAERADITSSSYKDTSPIGLIPTLMIHLIFMTSEALSPNTVMLGVEASTCELVEGEDTVQSIKTS